MAEPLAPPEQAEEEEKEINFAGSTYTSSTHVTIYKVVVFWLVFYNLYMALNNFVIRYLPNQGEGKRTISRSYKDLRSENTGQPFPPFWIAMCMLDPYRMVSYQLAMDQFQVDNDLEGLYRPLDGYLRLQGSSWSTLKQELTAAGATNASDQYKFSMKDDQFCDELNRYNDERKYVYEDTKWNQYYLPKSIQNAYPNHTEVTHKEYGHYIPKAPEGKPFTAESWAEAVKNFYKLSNGGTLYMPFDIFYSICLKDSNPNAKCRRWINSEYDYNEAWKKLRPGYNVAGASMNSFCSAFHVNTTNPKWRTEIPVFNGEFMVGICGLKYQPNLFGFSNLDIFAYFTDDENGKPEKMFEWDASHYSINIKNWERNIIFYPEFQYHESRDINDKLKFRQVIVQPKEVYREKFDQGTEPTSPAKSNFMFQMWFARNTYNFLGIYDKEVETYGLSELLSSIQSNFNISLTLLAFLFPVAIYWGKSTPVSQVRSFVFFNHSEKLEKAFEKAESRIESAAAKSKISLQKASAGLRRKPDQPLVTAQPLSIA